MKLFLLLWFLSASLFAADEKYDVVEESLRRTSEQTKTPQGKYSAVEEALRRNPQATHYKTSKDLDPNEFETVKDYLDARDQLNKEELRREFMLLLMIMKK